MTVHYYRYDPVEQSAAPPQVPPQMQIRTWQPGRDGPPRRPISNFFWWGLAKAGAFSRPGFTEFCIDEAGKRLHRLIVTPRWYRFPFMAADDLQIGDVWTCPKSRRQQLARIGIAEVHRRFADEPGAFWYVTAADNAASARRCSANT